MDEVHPVGFCLWCSTLAGKTVLHLEQLELELEQLEQPAKKK